MIYFKAVAMIRKYLLVCKKYPHRKSHFVQNTGVCIPTYVNILKASNFSLNLIGLNANFLLVLRASGNCLFRALVFTLDTTKTCTFTSGKRVRRTGKYLVCLECQCLSSKYHYNRRSLKYRVFCTEVRIYAIYAMYEVSVWICRGLWGG